MIIKAENHYTTLGWMRTELGLKGNDLNVYAIIYGFSQTSEQKFTGSLQYLADWCGSTKQGILKNLKNLIDKGLIEKHEIIKNNVKFCEYSCTVLNSVEQGIKLSLTNNKDYNKEKKVFISKDINTQNSGKSDFIGSAKKSKQPSLYLRCMNQIDNFILKNKIPANSTRIRDLLATHLDIAFESKSIRGEKQYVGILNKLQQLVDEGDKYQPVIQYSIEHGYPTFYSQKSKQKKYSSSVINSESGKRHVESFTKEDERRLNEFQKECKKKGIRTTF